MTRFCTVLGWHCWFTVRVSSMLANIIITLMDCPRSGCLREPECTHAPSSPSLLSWRLSQLRNQEESLSTFTNPPSSRQDWEPSKASVLQHWVQASSSWTPSGQCTWAIASLPLIERQDRGSLFYTLSPNLIFLLLLILTMSINYRHLMWPDTILKHLTRIISLPRKPFEAGTMVPPILRGGKNQTQRLSNLLKVKQPRSQEARIRAQTTSLSAHSPYTSSYKRTARFQGSKSQAS